MSSGGTSLLRARPPDRVPPRVSRPDGSDPPVPRSSPRGPPPGPSWMATPTTPTRSPGPFGLGRLHLVVGESALPENPQKTCPEDSWLEILQIHPDLDSLNSSPSLSHKPSFAALQVIWALVVRICSACLSNRTNSGSNELSRSQHVLIRHPSASISQETVGMPKHLAFSPFPIF